MWKDVRCLFKSNKFYLQKYIQIQLLLIHLYCYHPGSRHHYLSTRYCNSLRTDLPSSTTGPYRWVSMEQLDDPAKILRSSAQNPLRNSYHLGKKSQNLYKNPTRPHAIYTPPTSNTSILALSFTLALLQQHWSFWKVLEHSRFTSPSGSLHLQCLPPGFLLEFSSLWYLPGSIPCFLQALLKLTQIPTSFHHLCHHHSGSSLHHLLLG